jgi:hypothetical protein
VTQPEHGTYAGWNWHQRTKTPCCEPCREAARAYRRRWRTKNPATRLEEERMTKVRGRALWRLAAIHPTEFHALVQDEDRADRAAIQHPGYQDQAEHEAVTQTLREASKELTGQPRFDDRESGPGALRLVQAEPPKGEAP